MEGEGGNIYVISKMIHLSDLVDSVSFRWIGEETAAMDRKRPAKQKITCKLD